MGAVDRLVNAIRRLFERAAPWYDPVDEVTRRRETERVRVRSIAARIRAEKDIAARYRQADRVIRR